ncbi:glycosyltransferase family 2 protein [Asticcacaulis sp. MM231]|uniref:glycosyltransferase n=1 Tax=Asticcacaulis sp. MM231 TaxID=3157666 RepID=UPI0032D570B8
MSLIVSTRNRAEQLKACLTYVAAIQTSLSWEVILVDNNSNDNTQDIIADFIQAQPALTIRSLVCTQVGGANGHNMAVREAQSDIFSFVDDDCYVSPSHIDDVAAIFSDPEIQFAGGGIILHDETDDRLTTNYETNAVPFAPRKFIEAGYVQGANLMFRKKPFMELGGFDPLFGAGGTFSGADSELANRFSKGGFKGGFIRHPHGRKPGTTQKLVNFYDYGMGAILMKNIDMTTHGLHCAIRIVREIAFSILKKRDITRARQIIRGARHYHSRRAK